jgi:hypothetical protein
MSLEGGSPPSSGIRPARCRTSLTAASILWSDFILQLRNWSRDLTLRTRSFRSYVSFRCNHISPANEYRLTILISTVDIRPRITAIAILLAFFHVAFFHNFRIFLTLVVVLVSIEGSGVEVGIRGVGDNEARGGRKKSSSSLASGSGSKPC